MIHPNGLNQDIYDRISDHIDLDLGHGLGPLRVRQELPALGCISQTKNTGPQLGRRECPQTQRWRLVWVKVQTS